MSRKNYFEILKEQGFNPHDEYLNINNILNEKNFHRKSLRIFIEDSFLTYKNRGSFIRLEELEHAIENASDNPSDLLFSYTEMLLDLFKHVIDDEIKKLQMLNRDTFIVKQYLGLQHQIHNFLSLSNHELIEDMDGNSIIIEQNSLSSQASQILSESDFQNSLKILEFNHFRNQGNIDRKQEILKSLADLLEPKRKDLDKKLAPLFKKNNGSVTILKDLFEMFNKMHVRHYNGEQYISETNTKELEHWYDNIYNTVLMIIVAEDQIKILHELQNLKESLDN